MKFKQFLAEQQIEFNFGIFYVDAEGKDKSKTVIASLQSDALNKFKSSDSVKGYKSITAIHKGDVVKPSDEKQNLKESDLKQSYIDSMGLEHSSHDVWIDKSGNKYKWWNSNFKKIVDNEFSKHVLSKYPDAHIKLVYLPKNKVSTYMISDKEDTKALFKVDGVVDEEEMWKRASEFIKTKEYFTEPSNQEKVDNSRLIDKIKNKKLERNWDGLGNIQTVQVAKFISKMIFSDDDIKTRINVKKARNWDELISVIEKAKDKISFSG